MLGMPLWRLPDDHVQDPTEAALQLRDCIPAHLAIFARGAPASAIGRPREGPRPADGGLATAADNTEPGRRPPGFR
jgi:hypothetical protein